MSNPATTPKTQAEPSPTENLGKKKNRQKYLDSLETLSQTAKSHTDTISATATKVKDDYATFKQTLDEVNQSFTEDKQIFAAEKQNSVELLEAIKTSQSQANDLSDEISDLHTKIFGDDSAENSKGVVKQ